MKRMCLKKYFVIATSCMAGVFSTSAQITSEVFSVNVVGFHNVAVPPSDVGGGMQLMGVPFDAEPGTLDQVVGTSGVAADNALSADNIILFDPEAAPGSEYRRFYLRNNPDNNDEPMWRFAGTPQYWATNEFLYPNDGFWYVNRASESVTNLLSGNVVNIPEVTVTIVPGLQLLSYPFSAPASLHEMGLTNGIAAPNALSADNITLYDPTLPPGDQYIRYYLRPNPDDNNTPMWRFAGIPQTWATNVVIQPHQGFWYHSRAEEPFDWIVQRPYLLD
jgi:hypothetical protein